jgi:MoxR-like ATPase
MNPSDTGSAGAPLARPFAPTSPPAAGDSASTQDLLQQLSKAVVGQPQVLRQTLVALAASGHVLIEGVPGLGKTLLVRALAKALQLSHARIQFTPDMMPSDITGHVVLAGASDGGVGQLVVRHGPVFTQLLLADEINRAPAKTQAALLEVMQEQQVTLEGRTLPLPRPFMVLATQNPLDTEGTYPLPEAQLDRFLFKLRIDYPESADEVSIVERATHRQAGDRLPLDDVHALMDDSQLLALQAAVAAVHVDSRVVDFAVRLARTTRGFSGLANGAGTRGAIALVRAARAAAHLDGRDFATPDDVKRFVLPALRHRVMLAPDAQLEGRDIDALLQDVVDSVEAPRL